MRTTLLSTLVALSTALPATDDAHLAPRETACSKIQTFTIRANGPGIDNLNIINDPNNYELDYASADAGNATKFLLDSTGVLNMAAVSQPCPVQAFNFTSPYGVLQVGPCTGLAPRGGNGNLVPVTCSIKAQEAACALHCKVIFGGGRAPFAYEYALVVDGGQVVDLGHALARQPSYNIPVQWFAEPISA